MSRGLRIIWAGVLDILFPKKCLGCGREGVYICKDCETFLSEVDMTEVRPQSYIMSVWEYEGLMEKLIQKIKHDGCYDIVGDLVKTAFNKIDLNLPKNTIITFVPMYKKKEKYQGFNPAEIIAKKIGEATGRPAVKLLDKIKDNRSQVGLSPQARVENVKDAFVLSSKSIPRTILLIDDFHATGVTVNECIGILKNGGAANVFGFTLARQSVVKAK